MRLHLEGPNARRYEERPFENFVEVASDKVADRIGMHAEHAGNALRDLLRAPLLEFFDEPAPAQPVELVAKSLQTSLQVDRKDVLEVAAVFAF